MAELHHRHVEGINPDDLQQGDQDMNDARLQDPLMNDNDDHIVIENNEINQGQRNNGNRAIRDQEEADHAFEMISQFPYSYARYSIAIFRFGNYTCLFHIIPIIYVLYHSWNSPRLYNIFFRIFLSLQLLLSCINIPFRIEFTKIFKNVLNSSRSRAVRLTRALSRNRWTIFNKYLNIFTYSSIAIGFTLVFLSRYFETTDHELKYVTFFITAFSSFKIVLSGLLLIYYLKNAFVAGDSIHMSEEELSKIPTEICPNDTEEVCSICWEQFKQNQVLRLLPCKANHKFHDNCIIQWISQNTTCPICREDFSHALRQDDEDEEEEVEIHHN